MRRYPARIRQRRGTDRSRCKQSELPASIPGLYAASDIRAKKSRQITTAVADGTIAALAVQRFLRESRTG